MQRQTNTKVWIRNDELHWKAECFGQNGGMRYRPQGGRWIQVWCFKFLGGKQIWYWRSWYPGIKLKFVMWYIQWVGAARICCFVLYGVNGKISFTHVDHGISWHFSVGCDLSESQRRFASCRCASAVYVVGFIGFRLSALSKKPPPWPQWWPLDSTVKELLNRQKIFFHGETFQTKKKTPMTPTCSWLVSREILTPGNRGSLPLQASCRWKPVHGRIRLVGA